MLLVECSMLKKYYGDRLILETEKLNIYSEDRIGIVGINGAGKTTLLDILSQRVKPDEGWVRLYGSCAYLSQLEAPEKKRLSTEMASRFKVPETWHENMSGGEKTRFKLAQSLDRSAALIFADEPTSNMDLEGIELMERQFVQYSGALILISHDRSFLDKLCTKILELENGKVTIYNGNYSDYNAQKARERARAQFEYLAYLDEKKRLERAVQEVRQKSKSVRKTPTRMGNSEARLHKMGDQKAKASFDRAFKATETRIEQLVVKEKPPEQGIIKFDLADAQKLHSKVIIEGKNIFRSYGGKEIFKDAEFKVLNGAKIALIGPNGCGKSTLLKMIIEAGKAQSAGGTYNGGDSRNSEDFLKIAPAARIGYFSQDMSILEEQRSILANVMDSCIYPEAFARTLLARLLFKGEDVHKRIEVLSGGERVKVAFAKILLQPFNLLILDEPTNYLDIDSLEVIEEALQNYGQTLLFVSHDRSFIRALADQIMTIEDGQIKLFKGNYEEYSEHLANGAEAKELIGTTKAKQPSAHISQDTEKRQAEIMLLQHRLSEVVSRISLPSKNDDVAMLDREYKEILRELKRLRD